ncbi:MAG: hypothetical protein ACYDDN_11530, partial [Candidatus Desulforudaceae bacterium]
LQYWLRYLARRHPRMYALKLDISKYFYRVDHDILLKILGRIIVDFCGYRIWPTHRLLRKIAAKKMRRRLRYLQRAYARGEVSLETTHASVQSYMGLLKHCDSYNLRQKLFGNLVFVREMRCFHAAHHP